MLAALAPCLLPALALSLSLPRSPGSYLPTIFFIFYQPFARFRVGNTERRGDAGRKRPGERPAQRDIHQGTAFHTATTPIEFGDTALLPPPPPPRSPLRRPRHPSPPPPPAARLRAATKPSPSAWTSASGRRGSSSPRLPGRCLCRYCRKRKHTAGMGPAVRPLRQPSETTCTAVFCGAISEETHQPINERRELCFY